MENSTTKNIAQLNKLIHHNINGYCVTHPLEEINELSRAGMGIIIYLYDHMDEVTYQKDIENEFSARKSTVSSVITNLEEKGYVRRIPVKEDKRLKQLVLTEKADAITNHIRNVNGHINGMIRKDISDEDMLFFNRILEKMTQNMKEGLD